MSLDFTAPTAENMYEFMQEKVWYKFEDQTAVWEAWATDAGNSSNANIDKYDGRALTFMFDTSFINGWTDLPAEFVRKWSGGCLEDYSSSMGGFCLLEDSDTNMSSVTTIYDVNQDVVDGDTNRAVLTYRISKDEFTALSTRWTDAAQYESAATSQDGRVYQDYLENSTTLGLISSGDEYLDYPKCANTGNQWFCQMFVRAVDQQVDGYPAFVTPGVVTGYFIASLVPVEMVSFAKATQVIQTDGAMTTTAFASAIVAAIASLAF